MDDLTSKTYRLSKEGKIPARYVFQEQERHLVFQENLYNSAFSPPIIHVDTGSVYKFAHGHNERSSQWAWPIKGALCMRTAC